MKSSYAGYDSRDADYFLREAISNLKGKIDFIYFGGLDEESEEGKLEYLEKLRISTDTLYSLLNSNIIEKANKIKELHSILMSDLELAKRVQESILPDSLNIEGLQISTRFIPMSVVGGDIYDITEIRPGYIRIFLADATGHGVQAALVTMIIKSEYETKKKHVASPSQLLKSLSEEFFNLYKKLSSFFTCIVIDIDLKNKKVIYSSAGHPVQYVISNKGEIIPLVHTGRIIGVFEKHIFEEFEIPIDNGYKLLIFSDGIYEEFNSANEEYGEHLLQKAFEKFKKCSIDEMITKILDEVYAFIGSEAIHDDITVIGIDINTPRG